MAAHINRNCCPSPTEEDDDIATNFILKLKLNSLLRKKTNVADEDKIVVNILSRLPVKTLLRCKLVSKSWLFIISSRDFIRTHLSRSTDNPHFTHHQLILCDAHFLPQEYHKHIDFTVRNENLKLACCSVDYCLMGLVLSILHLTTPKTTPQITHRKHIIGAVWPRLK